MTILCHTQSAAQRLKCSARPTQIRSAGRWRAGAALAILGSVASAGAQADTLVNIKGYGDDGAGANIYSYPVAPGTIVGLFNPVLVNLAAGDYLVSDAWGQPGALYDAWNFQSTAPGSWGSHFVAAEQLGNGQFSVLLDGAGLSEPSCKNHFCAWDTEAEATQAFLNTPAFKLHLSHDSVVAFAAADYYLPDNLGGMSLQITAVPEPSSWALMLTGVAALGVMLGKRRLG